MPFDTDAVLFEQLRPRLQALSRRIVGSAAAAEDIVQDCFLKWRLTDQGALATPAAWLTTVVRHGSIDYLRQHARAAQAAHTAMELLPAAAPATPDDGLLRRAELGAALARLLAHLSPSERLALVLHDVFECDHAAIAAALGMKAVNARQHLARARRRLRAAAQEGTALPAPEETLCRDLVRRFQAAINGRDVPAMLSLLAGEQPVSVHATARRALQGVACANDAAYALLPAMGRRG
jgi:RNA polymerase sigma factor (sigma-70 family)